MAAIRALVIIALCGVVCAAQPVKHRDVTVASGKLRHHFLTNDLFRIDTLWMQVSPDTLFHRWLSQGINDKASIVLTFTPEKFGDAPNLRILTGKLVHQTAPNTSPIVHMVFLQDPQLGTTGPVTFETDDHALAAKFDAFDDQTVSIVMRVK